VRQIPLHSSGAASRWTALLLAHVWRDTLACRALSSGRITALGVTRNLPHGTLAGGRDLFLYYALFSGALGYAVEWLSYPMGHEVCPRPLLAEFDATQAEEFDCVGVLGQQAGVGDEVGLLVGDLVGYEQIVPCQECRYCLLGQYQMCQPHHVYGFHQVTQVEKLSVYAVNKICNFYSCNI